MKKICIFILLFSIACHFKNNWKCIEGNCINGVGKRQWADGGFEKGNWINGKLNGQGEQFFGSNSDFAGDTYIGEFVNDLYSGKGIYYDKSEDAKYDGEWINGKFDGKGIARWGDKSKYPKQYYDGEWKEGKKDGYGTIFWGIAGENANHKYQGEWKNDQMNGYGRYDWPDGSHYIGFWENDNQQGEGIYTFPDGRKLHGTWIDGYCKELAIELYGHE